MWRKALLHQLSLDMLPLRRKGLLFTWKTLDELRARLLRATAYDFGDEASLAERIRALPDSPRPSLFDREERVLPLPQEHMLLEGKTEDGLLALLLTDRQSHVEAYAFRYSEEKKRWRWPLLGMTYGPSGSDLHRVAVYEPTVLRDLSRQAQNAMVREHARAVRHGAEALLLIRQGLLPPMGEAGPTAAEHQARREDKAPLPAPSSFARAARTRHETGGQGRGARRQ